MLQNCTARTCKMPAGDKDVAFWFLRRYVDQGGGKRPGAFAVYIEPWHADVLEVLEMKKNHGKDELRAR